MLALTLFFASAATACGGSSSTASPPSPTATPTSILTGLEALLIPNAPSGYVQQPDNVGNTGPSDLIKAAQDDGRPDATDVLSADGFDGGYQRLWEDSSQTDLIVYIYSFTDSTGAAKYGQRAAMALTSQLNGVVIHPFTVSGVPGATGVYGTSSGSPIAAVVFQKDNYLFQIAMQGPNATVSATTTVFQEQLARIP
jgi:hypothetical protein